MNKKMSFCIKNADGEVSLIRHLTIKSDGSCYISYDNRKNEYHFSLHAPNKNYKNGQMHLKEKKRIVFKCEIPKFYDFNEHRISESILILGSELSCTEIKIHKNVKVLEIPNDYMAHIIFIRSDKIYGKIKEAFISNEITESPDEIKIRYPVFYSVEDMPGANYYLTYYMGPIDKYVWDYINIAKYYAINTRWKEIKLGIDRGNGMCVFFIRHPFINTEIEICVTNEDVEKYKK